jgi:ribose 5-phosphate isomerase B
MEIVIGSDHGGYELKEAVKAHLQDSGEHSVTDMGVYSPESSDYPILGHRVAGAVARGEFRRGVLICGSGIGMSVTANRHKDVRAALCYNLYAARMSRLHNDANILVLGARVTAVGLSLEIVDVFLKTAFEGGRHQRRVAQIDRPET